MELVTVFTKDSGGNPEPDKFKMGANVRGVTSEEIALNSFAVKVGDFRVDIGISSLTKQIVPGWWVRRFDDNEYKVQTIDESEYGRRGLFVSGS